MLFSSVEFLCGFLPFTLMVYYLLPGRRLRNRFLLLASLFFYAWGEPLYVLLMLACIAGNYTFGLLAALFRRQDVKWLEKLGPWPARLNIVLMLAFNLGLLGVYKYAGFVVSNLNQSFGLQLEDPGLVLPIGISFFTFQGMSYVLDVFRGQAQARRNVLDVGLYVAFFPQLIAGPIVRYNTIAKEIDGRRENWRDFAAGVDLFIIGLGKKVLLANNFALIAEKIFDGATYDNPLEMAVAAAWIAAVAYTLQIYFDFSGYSDMALGLGRMFGFHFLPNFNYPYVAHSVTDFWRRWHMSLSSWFRDYVYIPLGGNRLGLPRQIVNLFAVWLLTGLWHGANWTFVVWGLYYFCFLAVEKICREKLPKLAGLLGKIPLLGNLVTMLVVIIGWVIFRSADLSQAVQHIGLMFGVYGNPLTDEIFTFQMLENRVQLAVACVACLPLLPLLKRGLHRLHVVLGRGWVGVPLGVLRDCCLLLMLLLALAALAKGSYNPFIYFNF